MPSPSWYLHQPDPGYSLASRMAIQGSHPVVATRSFVAEDPSGFVRVTAGVTRVHPSHPVAKAYPDCWRAAPRSHRHDGRPLRGLQQLDGD